MFRTTLAALALVMTGPSVWAQTAPASVLSGAEVLAQLQAAAATGQTSAAAATIRDGQTRTVRAGDIVLVPVNTPHWYSHIAQPLTYLEVRFDVK